MRIKISFVAQASVPAHHVVRSVEFPDVVNAEVPANACHATLHLENISLRLKAQVPQNKVLREKLPCCIYLLLQKSMRRVWWPFGLTNTAWSLRIIQGDKVE